MRAERALTWVAGAATAVLVLVLLVKAPATVRAMMSERDYVSPLVMGHDAHLYPGARIVLGNYGWWPGMWAVQWLRPLPASAQLAAGLPLLLTLLASAALALQARRVWGGAAAIATLAVSLSVGTAAWTAAASWAAHFPTWWAMVLAGVSLTALAGAPAGRARSLALLGAVLAVAASGTALSGDSIGWPAIVAPLAACAGVLAVLRSWRPAAVAAGMATGVVAVSLVVGALAESNRYVQHDFSLATVPFALLGHQAAQTFEGTQQVWAGAAPTVVGASTGFLGAALVLGGLAVGTALLLRRRRDATDLPDDRRATWVTFWLVAALAQMGAFALTYSSVVGGVIVPRYLYGVPLAAAALIAAAVGTGRGRRTALAACALIALGTGVNFITDPPARQPGEHGPALANVIEAARETGVDRGYASYVTAYPMQRASRFALRLSPVSACPEGAPGLCPMYLHRLDGAYEPEPGIRSFLLVDASPFAVPGDRNWVTAPLDGVEPVQTLDVGDGLTMLIYDHDIAADLGPLPRLDQ